MKQIKLVIISSMIVGLALISSCSKDDESTLSKLELLTQEPWKLKSVTVVGLGSSPPESFHADDIYTFSADGVYTFDEGPTKEDPSDPQTATGSWEFAENETIIKLTTGPITLNQQIVELNTNTLKVKFNLIFDLEQTFGH